MDHTDRWEQLGPLGEGGQGKVYRVRDTGQFNVGDGLLPRLGEALRVLGPGVAPLPGARVKQFENFAEVVQQIMAMNDPANQGALKVLHEPHDARNPDSAQERIRREINAMRELSHPNLITLRDADDEYKWFVTPFYQRGTLTTSDNRDRFRGDAVSALRAFRALVEGVVRLHAQGVVHRDIKPANVFVGYAGELILGDLGLVYFEDPLHTRLSETFENVGTRDWMPPWAIGVRVDEVRPTFDVFALGKLLWYMISGRPYLQLWYFDERDNDLTRMFPDRDGLEHVNALLGKCVVQREANCLANASALLGEVDKALDLVANDVWPFKSASPPRCLVCAAGHYDLSVDRDHRGACSFGLRAQEPRRFKVFVCDHCGNVKLFASTVDKLPPAWE